MIWTVCQIRLPFHLGGTVNTAAIRALAEIEHWVSSTGNNNDNISATRSAFMSSLRTVKHVSTHQQIIRFPASQTNSEKLTFVTMGFDNLKMAVDPLSEEDEKALLILLLEELNDMYPLNLGKDIICDRFLEGDIFVDDTMDCTDLMFIGASLLSNIIKHVNYGSWKFTDLTRPGWRINQASVAELVERVTATATKVNCNTADVILQLFDNSVYLVGGPGGEKWLPCKEQYGTYHIDGNLTFADESVVKDLVVTLSSLLQVLGGNRKLILTSLACYRVTPCCCDMDHLTNYRTPWYLPHLGVAVSALRDHRRDSLYTRRIPNFWVLCPNRIFGMGIHGQDISDEEAIKGYFVYSYHNLH
jgi:hypothetical protein